MNARLLILLNYGSFVEVLHPSMKSILLTLFLGITAITLAAEDNMKAFPPAEKGMTRHVLELPKMDDESAFKVELIVGKMAMVDTANRHFIGGTIEAETIEGWGVTRYIVHSLGPIGGTLRARVGGPIKEERFVSIGGEPYLIRYNSRLPVVVYTPKGAVVKYRIWSAGLETHDMDPG